MDNSPEPPTAGHHLTVADLLLLRCAATGASSILSSPSPSPSPCSPPRKKLKPSTPNPNPNPFSPISRPVLLVGTLSLPSSSSSAACRNHCLSFTDFSSSVCCYLLDFDPAAVGREIRVLAWNFVPFSSHGGGGKGGVLEVIRWCFAAAPELAPIANFLAPIQLNCSSNEPDLAARGRAFGVLRSVSPVFSVPHSHAMPSNADGRSKDSVGFLAEMLCCECDRCRVSPAGADRCHNFDKVKFVYFVEPASGWRPVVARLVGRLVSVSGLKKKMVFVGEKESYTMLVSTVATMVAACRSSVGTAPSDRQAGKCGGVYTGVVTGIYLQGMVIELDESRWLLIDDQQLAPPHSLRVGAVISVRNFRVIPTNFAWTRIVLLGTCIKTSIGVNSFSPADPKCHLKSESKGLLGKFLDSLEMPARFWALIMVSCFKRKFGKVFSEKEILGSKNKQGLAQTYAAKILSSKAFQPQCGLFMRFCIHNCGNSSTKSNLEACKLVIPLSNFICKCEALWVSILLKFWNDAEEVGKNQRLHHFLCEGSSYPDTIKRIIPSEDLGFVLMGSIKTSSDSGRLQLVDATGSIDVVIPDVLLDVSVDSIYEISDYKLVLEGPVTYLDHYDFTDPLSCKAIFQHFPYRKRVNHLMVYIIFYLRESNRLDSPSYIPSHVDSNNGVGLFHLLILSHKFPASDNFQHQNMSGCSSLFAEAMVLPYHLKFIGQGDCIQLAEGFRMTHTLSPTNFKSSARILFHIPCSLRFRTTNLHGTLVSSYSCGSDGTILKDQVGRERESLSRILLEFKLDSFIKYQLLRVGGYYLLKCPTEGLTSNIKGCGCLEGGKVFVNSQENLWSIAITFNGNTSIKEPTGDHAAGISSVAVGESSSRNPYLNELILLKPSNDFCQASDFHLDLSCEVIAGGKEEHDIRHYVLTGLCSYLSEVLSVSSCVQIMMAKGPHGFADLQSQRLVQGDIISLKGNIENIHTNECKKGTFPSSKSMTDNDQSRSICIHVADNNHMVRLNGYLSKHAYPVGIGPGARAIFHRVLLAQSSSRRHELLLTPVTYIEIISIRGVNQNEEESIITPSKFNFLNDGSSSKISLCLFSQLIHCMDSRAMRFHCRVATIFMLSLDNCLRGLPSSKPTNQSKAPKVKIPLAGFILDDGSSLCCCWADGARAELLLRLQEVAQQDVLVDLKFSKDADNRNLQRTVGCYLIKMLKKHKKIIIRNYGITPDLSCRDLEFSSHLQKVLSRLEEKLLKFIILNACQGAALNVIGSVLDPNALKELNVDLSELSPTRYMRNMWISEASYINPLEEARSLFVNLGNR